MKKPLNILLREKRKELRELAYCTDKEHGHGRADNILCEVLIALGRRDIVKLWDKVGKYYA